MQEVSKVLKYVRAAADVYFKVNQLNLRDLVFTAYGDSGWANAPTSKSQGGLVVLASEKKCLQEPYKPSLLSWKSHKHRRTLRGSITGQNSQCGQLFGMRFQWDGFCRVQCRFRHTHVPSGAGDRRKVSVGCHPSPLNDLPREAIRDRRSWPERGL